MSAEENPAKQGWGEGKIDAVKQLPRYPGTITIIVIGLVRYLAPTGGLWNILEYQKESEAE